VTVESITYIHLCVDSGGFTWVSSVAVRRDSVLQMREILEFVMTSDYHDKRAVRRYAVDKAVAINARDATYRYRAAELWNQLNLRGMTLMAHRSGPRATNVRAGWSVAAGS
jgi:pyocin large subunit-like protein